MTRQPIQLIIIGIFLTGLLAATPLLGQYPDRPITIINSNKPGGVIDVMSRKLAAIANKYEEVTIVVENVPGGSGAAAMNYVLNQPADGYTLLATLKSFISTGLLSETGLSLNDFQLVACLVYDWEALITNRNSSVVSFEDIITDAQRKNGLQKWLGPNTGGLDHLMALETWGKCGIQAKWIPFEGSSVSIAALLGGNGVVYVGNAIDTKGRPDLQVAAVAAPERLADFPDAPTFREKGFDLTQQMWRGFSVKRGTPEPELAFLENLFFQVSQDPEWQAFIKAGYADPVFRNHSQMEAQIEKEEVSARRLLTRAGVIREGAGKASQTPWFYLPVFWGVASLLIFLVYSIKKRPLDSGFIILALLMGASLYFLYQTFGFPAAQGAGDNGPAFMPRIWAGGLLILTLLALFKPGPVSAPAKIQKPPGSLIYKVIFLLFGYTGALVLFGFYISSFLFVVSMLWVLDFRRLLPVAGIAFSFLLLIYLLFEKALNINLPTGIWL